MAGFTCKIVNGYSRIGRSNVGKVDVPNHSWNAIFLNKKWYLVDATLASGFYNASQNTFVKSYNDGYFLARPELYQTRHYPLENKWLLVNRETSLNTFVKKPIVYGETFKNGVIPVLPEKMINDIFKNDILTFRLKTFEDHTKRSIKLLIKGNFKNEEVLVNQKGSQNGILSINHQFKRTGIYDTHIVIDDRVVATYVVKVSKDKNTKV